MLADIVIDTNVFAHAANPSEQRQAASVAFLRQLLDAQTVLCFDPGVSQDRARNTSRIQHEYCEHIPEMSFPYHVLAHLFATNRTRPSSVTVSNTCRRVIDRVVRDKSDRVFVRVSVNTEERTLVTHNTRQFPAAVKRTLNDECEVTVCEASEVEW